MFGAFNTFVLTMQHQETESESNSSDRIESSNVSDEKEKYSVFFSFIGFKENRLLFVMFFDTIFHVKLIILTCV